MEDDDDDNDDDDGGSADAAPSPGDDERGGGLRSLMRMSRKRGFCAPDVTTRLFCTAVLSCEMNAGSDVALHCSGSMYMTWYAFLLGPLTSTKPALKHTQT